MVSEARGSVNSGGFPEANGMKVPKLDNSLGLSTDSQRANRRSKMMQQLNSLSQSYVQKMKYGGVGKDQSDSEEED